MATLWEIVTGNSTLPVQAGNTFWDHLNNQEGGGGSVTVVEVAGIEVELDMESIEVMVEVDEIAVEVESAEEVTVEVTNEPIEITVELDETEAQTW